MQNLAITSNHIWGVYYDLSQGNLIEFLLLYDLFFATCCALMGMYMAFFYYNKDAHDYLEEQCKKVSLKKYRILMQVYKGVMYILLLYFLIVLVCRWYYAWFIYN